MISPGSVAQYDSGNADLRPAAIVRQVLDVARFDEHRLFGYRFDHKLAHFLVMRELTQLPMPESRGLWAFVNAASNERELASLLDHAFPSGYVIKRCLGAGSGDEETFDVTTEVLSSFRMLAKSVAQSDLDPYLVQERIPIAREYRVHTVEDEILEKLTLPRHDDDPIDAETKDRLAAFARECLASMSDALVYDAVCGWDVADTGERFVVIEINYTGFHPQWNRGFQTSGFLLESPEGARHLATWLRWMAQSYGLAISIASKDDQLLQEIERFAGE